LTFEVTSIIEREACTELPSLPPGRRRGSFPVSRYVLSHGEAASPVIATGSSIRSASASVPLGTTFFSPRFGVFGDTRFVPYIGPRIIKFPATETIHRG
jgi:hypothetical protein